MACVQALEQAGITIAKVQVTAGLRIPVVTADVLDELRRYEDAVYLHQVVERTPAGLQRYADLVDARTAGHWRDDACEWRVHFHVPVFLETLEPFASTQSFVRDVLAQQRQQAFATQLEVETYTWSVLPPQHRTARVEDAIARELAWVRGCLA